MSDDLDQAVDELYALPLEEFVGARAARAKRIRAGGDRELAQRVAALPKPTVAAWLLNQLARRRPDAVDQLVRLGADLRAVQHNLDGDQLRALSRRRQQLVRAFVREATQLADELGRPLSGPSAVQVEDSLRAAVADEGAGEALLEGRLSTPLSYVGMGEVGEVAAVTGRTKPAPTEQAEPDEVGAARERHRADARQALVDAEREHQDATTAVTRADQELHELERQHTALQERADELRAQLADVEAQIEELAERYEAAEEQRAGAAVAAATAAAGLERAQRDLD